MVARSARFSVFLLALLGAAGIAPAAVAAPSLPSYANLTLTVTQQGIVVNGGTPPGAVPAANLQHGCEFKAEALPVIVVAANGNISGGCNYHEPPLQLPPPLGDPFDETWTGSYSGTMNTVTGQVTFTHVTQHLMYDPVSGKTETYNITWNGTTTAHNDAGGSGGATFSYSRTCVPGTSTCSQASNMSYSGTLNNFNFTLDGPVTGVDAEVDHIEVVQVVQTSMNTVPLVADKTTVARVFLSSPLEVPITSVTLKARRNGQVMPGTATQLSGGAAVASPFYDRDLENNSVNFKLPMTWVTAGVTEFEAVLVHGGPSDGNPANNTRLETVTFQARRPLNIFHTEICIAGSPPSCAYDTTFSRPEYLEKRYPLPNGGLNYQRLNLPSSIVQPSSFADVDHSFGVAVGLGKYFLRLKLRDPQHAPDQVIGWIPEIQWFGGAADMGINGGSGGAALVAWYPGDPNASYDILTHEVAHNLGNRHVNTPDSCGSSDPGTDWPYANAYTQEVGWDTATDEVIPPTAYDLMSYCKASGPREMSPFTYTKLFNANSDSAKAADARISTNFMLLSGSARADGTSGTLRNSETITGTLDVPPSNPLGTHCIRYNDVPANDYCFTLEFVGPNNEPLSERGFALALPDNVATNIKLCKMPCGPSDTLATIAESPNSPTVSFVTPAGSDSLAGAAATISWTGSDVDPGSVLTYTLYQSIDGGLTYTPISIDFPGTSLVLDANELPQNSFSYFKVVVSDGMKWSDATVGPVTVGTPRPWGDLRCDGALGLDDVLALRRDLAGLGGMAIPRGCPVAGDDARLDIFPNSVTPMDVTWGALRCTGAPSATDALDLMKKIAGLPVTPGAGNCPDIGEPVFVSS